MKTFLAIAFLTIFSNSLALAAPQLGKRMEFEKDPTSTKLQFGAAYTYGNDPDGSRYVLTFNPLLALHEKQQHLVWNIFFARENSYLLDWDTNRETQLSVVQVSIPQESVVKAILLNQKTSDPADQIYFVLAKKSSFEPVYYFSISEMCQKFSSHFADLTNSKKCDEIKESDF